MCVLANTYKIFWQIPLAFKIAFVSQGEPALQPFANAHLKGCGRRSRDLDNETRFSATSKPININTKFFPFSVLQRLKLLQI